MWQLLASVALLGVLVSANPVPGDRFKQAYNRTFAGFEKVANNTQWSGNFTFIQGADTQFGLTDYFANNFTDRGNWTVDLAILQDAVKEWNDFNPVPRFVTICGDLVNDWPSNSSNNRRKQLDDFRSALTKLRPDVPLVLLGGNHDFLNTPTNASISEYTNEFGDDYFSFWTGGVMFIVLNVQLYKDNSSAPELYREQDDWLEQQLADAKASNYSHVIVFQHVPWFLKNITEPEDKMWTIAVAERQRVVDRLYASGVRFIFAGHYHRNAYGEYKDLQMVTTSAIGAQSFEGANANNGYRVVEVTRDKVTHRYVNITAGISGALGCQPALMMMAVAIVASWIGLADRF